MADVRIVDRDANDIIEEAQRFDGSRDQPLQLIADDITAFQDIGSGKRALRLDALDSFKIPVVRRITSIC